MKRVAIVEGSHAVFECMNCGGAKHAEIAMFHPMSKEQKKALMEEIKGIVLG